MINKQSDNQTDDQKALSEAILRLTRDDGSASEVAANEEEKSGGSALSEDTSSHTSLKDRDEEEAIVLQEMVQSSSKLEDKISSSSSNNNNNNCNRTATIPFPRDYNPKVGLGKSRKKTNPTPPPMPPTTTTMSTTTASTPPTEVGLSKKNERRKKNRAANDAAPGAIAVTGAAADGAAAAATVAAGSRDGGGDDDSDYSCAPHLTHPTPAVGDRIKRHPMDPLAPSDDNGPGGAADTAPAPEAQRSIVGALAVGGPDTPISEHSHHHQDEENPTGMVHPAPREEPLVNARLVEEGNNEMIVEAKPALEGFNAIFQNHRFKYIAAGFLLILLGVVVPLAVILPQSNKKSTVVLQGQGGPEMCGSREVNQADYRGSIGTTEGNITCQRWDQHEPHTHKFVLEDYSAYGLEENYCRNPDGESRAWCYSTDPDIRWQYCTVPYCNGEEVVSNTECGTLEQKQEDYRGTIAVTGTGKKCQRWDSQEPHHHPNTAEARPSSGMEENYCRNPDGEPFAWCYTIDPNTRWEFCDVPLCGSVTQKINNETCSNNNCTKQQCGTERLDQSDFRGNLTTTQSGRTCQRWDSQETHRHFYKPELYPNSDLVENYCRNPNPGQGGERWAWCLTTDPDKRFDYCEVPFCEDEFVPRRTCGSVSSQQQSDYRGDIAVSESGKECLSWNTAADAIANGHTPKDLPWDGLIGNFCRNPGNSQSKSWCYVAGGSSSFEFCDVPDCQECGSISIGKEDYVGIVSTAINGTICQHWVDKESEYSHHPLLEENYCRNPDGQRDTVWCYTDPESLDWEYCDVPDCPEEANKGPPGNTTCGSLAFRQSDYRGQINQTASGHTCQPWNSQTPHQHKYNPEQYPGAGLDENYCRQPDGSEFLAWCFVNHSDSAGVSWEYCSIPICEELSFSTLQKQEDCGTLSLKQQDYIGNISTTTSGWTCLEWGLQSPQHDQRHSPEKNTDLEENKCRNPDGSERAWCFSTNPDVFWEYCDVPLCQEDESSP